MSNILLLPSDSSGSPDCLVFDQIVPSCGQTASVHVLKLFQCICRKEDESLDTEDFSSFILQSLGKMKISPVKALP